MASNGIVNSLLMLLNLFSSIVAEFQLKLSLGDLIHAIFNVVVAPVGATTTLKMYGVHDIWSSGASWVVGMCR